ncbi:DUF4345 domain-containing protein [Winogradskyella haliclonae]|uniref:DUF4345 domain-containing protein n=1 Tax=Winogradskyella haliclonae TaxID=2048558 RepID=A0ABQ2BUS6_9FLAO|nr:DUF4345 domain-containing protein [Winogradskyella haliclonae]GGI56224.1 hypothetical protein GCM10011444_05330 [Winogradskyella haliclonae]
MKTKSQVILKIHLIISVTTVVPVAIIYGFFPDLEFELFPKTLDEHNFYKAIMGLYLASSIVWLLGIIKSSYLKIALISNIAFMLGLGFGRLISLFIDGTPTSGYLFGTFAELLLGFYGIGIINSKYYKKH